MFTALLILLVFASALAGELVQVLNVRRIARTEEAQGSEARAVHAHTVARLSVLEWCIGAVGWIVVVKTQALGYLIPEVIGLYLGSLIGTRIKR
jgi:hypothetical protein